MNTVFLWIAQRIAVYGFNKGLDKVFKDKDLFITQLNLIISQTIDKYQEKYPVPDNQGKFAFYKSEILIEEFLKYRLFAHNGYSVDVKQMQVALEKNPNILKPTKDELETFFSIFDDLVIKNDELKVLEIEEFHKEAIFEIYDKVEQILNLLELHLVEVVVLLEEEYKEEIQDCFIDIINLKPKSAQKKLIGIEGRIEKNSKHVSEKLKANLQFFIGICHEELGDSISSFECFIKAYRFSPDNAKYLEKACIALYFMKDQTYKSLKDEIEKKDDFNAICWAINTIENEVSINYIKDEVPQIVTDKHYFKRLVFNYNLKNNKTNNLTLLDALQFDKLSLELPALINHENLHHYIFLLNSISIRFFSTNEIPFNGNIIKNEDSNYFLQLSRTISSYIVNSELENIYSSVVFFSYWLESELEIKSSTIDKLTIAFNELKDKDSLRTMLFANSVQKTIGYDAALKILEKFEGVIDENLISLKTFCQLNLCPSKESISEYFSFVKEIDALNVNNICGFLVTIIKVNLIDKKALLDLIESLKYSNESYKNLVKVVIESLCPKTENIPLADINLIQQQLVGETSLYFFIAVTYFENNYYAECAAFIKSYLDLNLESRDLLLYIRALNSCKSSNQLELLRQLKEWRMNHSYNDYLLRIEIELRQILRDWPEILNISEYALSKLPDDEPIYTIYILSLGILEEKEKLSKEINKISGFRFQNTENALRVVNTLIQYNFFSEGLEICYQKALNKDDSIARTNYFFLTSNYPANYLVEYEEVILDSYVKYEIDGEISTLFIDSNSMTNAIIQLSIGKRKLETFSIENKFSRKMKFVKIVRIMNKYLALLDEILQEANSSFSNLPVESINFNSLDKEDIVKVFIDNFGPREEERKKHLDQAFTGYYTFNISFTQLVASNFNDSYIDAYYHLTSSGCDGFLIRPLKYLDTKLVLKEKKYVIDFTSGLLFYDLSEKMGLRFDKFIITKNLISLIDKTIFETEQQRNSKMTITFHGNRIIPHYYSEDYHDNRVKFLTALKNWFVTNSTQIIPEEKIEIIRPLYKEKGMTPTFEYFVDNAFLAQRENHILISDDLGYGKDLHVNNLISTERFLNEYFPARINEILEFLLERRYVGITLNKDVLYSAYINQHKYNQSHLYNYALRNISLKQNFSPFNIFVIVDFLKKIALSPVITHELYKSDATNLFVMTISSFTNPILTFTLKQRIVQKFNLMGDYLSLTLTALLDALEILNRK